MSTTLRIALLFAIFYAAKPASLTTSSQSFPRVKNVTEFIRAMPKVELHVHLGGAMNPSTLWELAQRKGVPDFPADAKTAHIKNAEDLGNFLQMRDNGNLPEFLDKFQYMLPQISGDAEAIERVARELCETKANEGVVYFETRYAPQFLTDGADNKKLTLEQVVQAVNKGLQEGSRLHGVTVKSILCCMRLRVGDQSKYSMDLAKLASKYRSDGVVGIDLAGDESIIDADHPDEEKTVEAFQYAFEHNVHRTVHAGEAGPASNVKAAMEILHAERIGHGYRVLEDDVIYGQLKENGIHLEECPYSSVKTGGFDLKKGWKNHPIRRFFEDGASFSINTDDPTVTGHNLVDDYRIVGEAPEGVGLPLQALVNSVRNGIDKAFIDEAEKTKIRAIIEAKLIEAEKLANQEQLLVEDGELANHD